MKILYAASENENAKIQLSRFLKAIEDKSYTIKIAAYKKSSPKVNIDWTLDCLKNIFKPEIMSFDNDNFATYYEQVKYYQPDLVISDLEPYTSYVANLLGITLWQCSSSMVNFALTNDYKYNLGVFKRYAYLFSKNPIHIQRLINVMDNSDRNLLYNHFGDSGAAPQIKDGFEWVRPYHHVGKDSIPCQHNVVAASLRSNKKLLSLLKAYPDSVYFTEFLGETYSDPILKNLANDAEYFCNLKNCNLYMCEGQTSFLADAFYNGKHTAVLTNLEDPECVLNSTISENLNLSTSIYQISEDLHSLMKKPILPSLKKNIKFLHERIEEL